MNSPLTVYRKKNGQTLEALASLLRVDKSTLWRWEIGTVPAARVVEVERVTRIPRRKLRPDIFGRTS